MERPTSRDFGGSNVTAIGRLLGASAAAAVLLLGVAVYAQTTEPAKKAAPKAKSVCNGLTEETACKANDTCRWIAASTDAKTGKQKRKAYCRTQGKSTKKKSTEPAKK
jgi:hypothetical protein